MQKTFVLEGIVVKRLSLFEKDRMITLITPTHGKVRALAKGCRRPGSALSGHLELFSHVKAYIAQGKSIDQIRQVEGLTPKPDFGADLERMSLAFYISEVAERLSTEDQEQHEAFRLLIRTLARLPFTDEPVLLVGFYVYRMLVLAGFQPDIQLCAQTGKPLSKDNVAWSPALGELVLNSAGGSQALPALPLNPWTYAMLSFYEQQTDKPTIPRDQQPLVAEELHTITHAWLERACESSLRSPQFQAEVGRLIGVQA